MLPCGNMAPPVIQTPGESPQPEREKMDTLLLVTRAVVFFALVMQRHYIPALILASIAVVEEVRWQND